MMSRNLYFQIIYRALAIVALALIGAAFFAFKNSYSLVILCLILEIPVIINLISYLNQTNRKIGYFLESIQNNDSALVFPVKIDNKPLKELYQSLKKINEQIQKLKIENLQREQYFQILLEHIPTGIVTFDSRGFVYQANSSAKKMCSVEVLTHIQQLERVNRHLYTTIRDIKPFEQKVVALPNERGTTELSIKSSPFKINQEDLVILSIQDIRNELDDKELNSWMKLIRVLMHEIMNTITPITSLSKSLGKYLTVEGRIALHDEIDDKTIETTVEGLNVINEQGKSLMHFVESYRKLTHLPHPDKKIFKIEDLINRIKVLYSSLENSENVKFITKVEPTEMELFADENLISLVLINLLKNALESIERKPEGRIQLLAKSKLNNSFKNGNNSRSNAAEVNRGIEISLIDNGPGIPDEIMEQIFVPFFTTHDNGSGIGLSLSRQIMRLHGGALRVHSIPDQETKFSLVF